MAKKKLKRAVLKQKKLFREKVLHLLREQEGASLNYKQVSARLKARDNAMRQLISELLHELAEQGQIEQTDRGKYRIAMRQVIVTGKVDMTLSGSAYIISDQVKEDVFVSQNRLRSAMDGDTVRVRLMTGRKRRPEGEVIEVTHRARNEYAGFVRISGRHCFLIPDNAKVPTDIYVPESARGKAKDGDKAIVRITKWGSGGDLPAGEITRVLGRLGSVEAEMLSILADKGFPLSFQHKVIAEAEKIPLQIPEGEIRQREDFRTIPTFTIDPIDAKDFDDALSLQRLENRNLQVGVHIADVTFYVTPGSATDQEAARRGTSVYLVDRVIPMLPEVLSNQLCSLRPGEDKLCFSVIFELTDTGKVVGKWFGRTVIHSDKRFAYEEAQQVLETGRGPFAEELKLLNSIAKTLRQKRMQEGSIAFNKAEVKFSLDEHGNPTGVYTKVQQDAHQLIEEYMLLANRAVAERIALKTGKSAGVFVYRVHDSPDAAKVAVFNNFISGLGYRLQTKSPKALANSMNQLIKQVHGRREQNIIEQLAIRTMAKAVYSTDNIGHYGLAFSHYTHFTSPIRRYPDMMVHRLLLRYLEGHQPPGKETIEEECIHSSEMERKAAEAEWDSVNYFQVLFLKDRVGETFSGVISGVTEWGLYVELEENKCEGMVRVRDIPGDYFALDQDNLRLVGRNSGKIYRLGDAAIVKLMRADLSKKQLDFELADGN